MKKTALPLSILFLVTTVACGLAIYPSDQKPVSEPAQAEVTPTVQIVLTDDETCEEDICLVLEPTDDSGLENLPLDINPMDIQPKESLPEVQPDDTLYLGIMIHLEGWDDDMDEGKFEKHAAYLREVASLFETYGAHLTLESKEMTPGSILWGDNVLYEMEQRGHAIGVHADVGGQKKYACKMMTEDLRQKKEELESLGVTVRHVSGIVSHCDWVTAAVEAGYLFNSGVVQYGLMSLDTDIYPDWFTGCENPAACHQPYPPELEGRLHPWRANSGEDWIVPNRDGKLVILPSGGSLVCMQEEMSASGESVTQCDFNAADIDAIMQELEHALELVDGNQVNMYYLSWSIGKTLDPVLLNEFLTRVQPYVVTGDIQWATLPEMYDRFVSWEEARGRQP